MEATVRIGAACMMTAASAWGGRLLAAAQGRRAETLDRLAEGVRRLEIEMLERRMPVREALESCGLPAFQSVVRQMEGGAPPGTAYGQAEETLYSRGGALDCLEEGDRTALKRLFGGLGAGGLQAQRLVLHEAEGELDRLANLARRRREEQGKLYASLGGLAGLALAIILL